MALREEGFSDDLLLEAGVAGRSRHGRLYDRMRNRVIFPIHDEHGAPRGFAGRLLSGDGPKYLNTPETELYQKRSLLYGLHLAHQPILDAGKAVVVEGYTDAIAAHQAGLTNVVATGGTALTEEHLENLRESPARSPLRSTATRLACWQLSKRPHSNRPTSQFGSWSLTYPEAWTQPIFLLTEAQSSTRLSRMQNR